VKLISAFEQEFKLLCKLELFWCRGSAWKIFSFIILPLKTHLKMVFPIVAPTTPQPMILKS
jgi:hypothetical protein